MTRPRLPSRAHAAGLAAFALAAALLPVRAELAALPLLAFVALAFTAPYFPGWSLFLPVTCRGPRSRPEVALTFDDGPDARTLPALLALLAEAGAPAAFFVVGRRVAAQPEAVRALLAAGHELGNHSDRHDVFLALRSPAHARRDLLACQAALAVHGVRPLVFRPPVGITSPPLAAAVRRLGLRCVAFSCRPRDFANRRLRDLAGRVLRRVRPGDVILLHDTLPEGVAAETWLAEVRAILAGLRARGLRPVPLSALLGVPVMERVAPAPGAGPGSSLDSGPAGAGPTLGTSGAGMGSDPAPRARSASRILSQVLGVVFTVGYPLLVLGALSVLGARWGALALLALLVASRARTLREDLRRARGLLALAASVAALLLLAAALDEPRFLLAYPSLVNAALLLQFGWTLRAGPSMAERFARLQVSDLSPAEIRYCRRVTATWCAFFVLNGGAATALALWAPRPLWAAYTGGVSYLLMGTLFAVEYVVRKARHGRFGPGALDRALARVLRREAAP